MKRIALAALAGLLALGAAVAPVQADDLETCGYSPGSDDVIAACSRLIARNPGDAVSYYNRGVGYDRKSEYDRAIIDYNEAIRLNPKYAVAYTARGAAYTGKGEYDRAIADLNEAIRLDPNNAAAYTNRGAAYNRKGEYDRVIADCDQAIRLDPKDAVAYANRGFAYDGKGDYVRAVADYDEALRLDPNLSVRRNRDRAQAALAALPGRRKPADDARPASSPHAAERRVALVIGNSQYRSVPVLRNPARDARAVADALSEDGFQSVDLVMDLDRDGLVKALRAFRDKADQADWALVYFAGHGLEIDRLNYLVPIDAKLLDDRDVKDEAVSYESVLNAAAGARLLRLVVLDACRVNPFKDRMLRTIATRSPTDRGLAPPPETKPGTLVVYAAKDGEVAEDGDSVNSPFARAFVAQLKVPGREVRRLFDFVRDDVLAATRGRQQPFTYGSLPAAQDFFFVAAK